jgi:hypothetical protein
MLSDDADGDFGTAAAAWLSIRDEEHLQEVLAALTMKGPRLLKLLSPQHGTLYLGLGGPWGFAEYRPPGSDGAFRTAKALTPAAVDEDEVFFVYDGVASEIDPEYVLPSETAIKIALNFFRTGELGVIEWE